jgi:hypothetical protein
MNSVKYSIILSLMLVVAGMAFSVVPALAARGPGDRPGDTTGDVTESGPLESVVQLQVLSCLGSAQITGAGVVHFNAGEMKTLTYTLVWTGLLNNNTFAVSTTAAPAGWTFNLLTTSVNVGASGASGSAPIQVQVTAPVTVDTATMTVSASDGMCNPAISASLTSSFASVPEFAMPAVIVASITMLGIAFARRSIIK